MKLEVCSNSYKSAINAQLGGADRIELCADLSIGGITPSYATIKKTCEKLNIPVFVLIRPRGGDFVYSEEEFQIMINDIEACKELGCDGIVSGVLTNNVEIDIARTEELVKLSHPLEFTFHRAFDVLNNPLDGCLALANIGVSRILTSGLSNTALNGIDILKKLKDYSPSELTIMPGAGINSKNAVVFKTAGFTEIHSSASRIVSKSDQLHKKFFGQYNYIETDIEEVKKIKSNIRG